MNAPHSPASQALQAARDEIQRAMAAPKCHGCGCLRQTIDALVAGPVLDDLAPVLRAARETLVPKKYDCLGCETCYPALAANALAGAFPDALGDAALCPTEPPTERTGWPRLPGDYCLVRYGACVAVCTLNSEDLMKELASAAPNGLAIVGTLHTENLGIERVIQNALANPNIRFLVLCGDDAQRLVGHLPGQSLESLFANGVDDRGRILGAKGKRPFLKNITGDEIRSFTEQVQLVSMIGERNATAILHVVAECDSRKLPPVPPAPGASRVQTVHSEEPRTHRADPAGFLVIYPDRRTGRLVVEHYTNAGVLDCIVEGSTPPAVYAEVIKKDLVSRLDHAAYLGRELESAARSMRTREPYIQDAAPGEVLMVEEITGAGTCGPSCKSCQ